MIKNKHKFIIALVFLIIIALSLTCSRKAGQKVNTVTRIINPVLGDVAVTVATTGIVEPQNRLEIKPSISGRIEKILVKEGDHVKQGDILAWMSSTERAALVDAARSQGEEAMKYWEEAYKKSPVVSPIDGEVIVRAVEPGQTVTASDAILVLSDRLVVKAQFDETDIGRVKVGQKAAITLDAYPDIKIEGTVDHIAYESEIVNNVTIYEVDILPKEVPEMLRSGMSATVEVLEKEAKNVLTVPSGAIHYEGKREFVLVEENYGKVVKRDVVIGLNNDKIAEILSGLTQKDKVVTEDVGLPKRKTTGTNPFMPSRGSNR